MGEKDTTMAQYSLERKQAILDKLLSPKLISIAQLARDENIAEQTLYNGVSTENGKNSTLRNFVEYLQN